MKHFFTILLIQILGSAIAQGLSLDDLIQFQAKSFEHVNDILVEKGWQFSGSKKKSDSVDYSSIIWSYDKTNFGTAKGWLTLYASDRGDNYVIYKFYNSNYYLAIKEKVVAYKMKVDENAVEDNNVTTVFRGQKFTVSLTLASENGKSSYIALLVPNETISLVQLQNILGLKGDKSDDISILEKRANYGKPSGRSSGGSSLDLIGWQWDKIPMPNVPNNESGRIVFEIKVDQNGQIISMRTIERSVSLETEEICRKEIVNLTFTKTSSNNPPITTGRITFIIRTK